MEALTSKCLQCKEDLIGRIDKKFCTAYCKSAYHASKNKIKEASLFVKIDRQLKKNRRILKEYNKSGLSTVRKETLIGEGFNPKYFTHYWKNSKGEVYLFCYEYGFLNKVLNGKQKYVLIMYQPYMGKVI